MFGSADREFAEKWKRPPNFLLVDYYNIGLPTQGSVFDVAAKAELCAQTCVMLLYLRLQNSG